MVGHRHKQTQQIMSKHEHLYFHLLISVFKKKYE